MVYFILARLTNRIKIGVANNVDSRYNYLRRDNADDLELLGSVVGDEDLETEIHAQIESYRAHNEWFDANQEVRLLVDRYLHPEAVYDSLSVSEQV
jgi:hypothetical protein